MDKFPKMYESWACLVNTPGASEQQQIYNIVNLMDNYIQFNKLKFEQLEQKSETQRQEIASLKNEISNLNEKIDLLENNIEEVETSKTRIYTSMPLQIDNKLISALTVKEE